MGLNCRPAQLAWIDVPRTPQNAVIGMDQLQGYVVKTVRLLSKAPQHEPAWIVEPQQRVRVPADFECQHGVVRAGDVLVCDGIPDSFLRPFKDLPPELFEEQMRVLQELGP